MGARMWRAPPSCDLASPRARRGLRGACTCALASIVHPGAGEENTDGIGKAAENVPFLNESEANQSLREIRGVIIYGFYLSAVSPCSDARPHKG